MVVSRSAAWTMWLIATCFYAYQYILRVMPNIILPDILSNFNIDAALFGQFTGVYYLGYALFHVPIGISLDRYGPRKIISICIILTALGLIPLVTATHWVFLLIGRVLIGIGSSGAILGLFKVIRLGFEPQHFTRILGFSVTFGLLGAVYGGGPVKYLHDVMGFAFVVKLCIGLGLILAILTLITVPKTPAVKNNSVVADLKNVLSNTKVLKLCFLAGLMVGPLEGFADAWGATFLHNVYELDSSMAGYLPSFIFIGMCFGATILGLLAEKSGRYLEIIMGCGVIMLAIFIALINKSLNVTGLIIGFLLIGVCCAYQILAIFKCSTYVSENCVGLTTAIANMIIMSFGYAFHSAIGLAVTYFGGVDSAAACRCGLCVVPLALGLGITGLLYVYYQEKTQGVINYQELAGKKFNN